MFTIVISEFMGYHCEELQDLEDCLMTENLFNKNMITVKCMLLNRHFEPVPGDGNCLFQAVSDQLLNHPFSPLNLDHITLRHVAVNYMRLNKATLEVILYILLKFKFLCNLKCKKNSIQNTYYTFCFSVSYMDISWTMD